MASSIGKAAQRSMQRPSPLPLYVMLFAMQCARSMFIVLLSWFTLEITGTVRSVGKVLICWQLLAFTVGPLLGPHLDRLPRRHLFALGESLHAAGVLLLSLVALFLSPVDVPMAALYACACLASLGSLLSYPTSQALLQRTDKDQLARTVAFSLLGVQTGNIAGAALAGLGLPLLGVAGGLAICAAWSFVAVLSVSLLKVDSDRGLAMSRARHGLVLLGGTISTIGDPRLRASLCALMLAYASAHASNALLAGFARDDLKLSGELYGWIAAMYSGGGLLGCAVLARFIDRLDTGVFMSIGSVLISLATALLSTAQTLAEAMLWQGLIGLSFMMIRVAGDATVLKTVPNRRVGRVRSNIEAAIGLAALVVYLIASLSNLEARQTFLGLSGLFACAAVAVVLLERSQPRAAATCPPRRPRPRGLV